MFFPFMVDISEKTVLIIGGGVVAFRKFELMKSFGADIRVVSPELNALFSDREGEFEHIPEKFRVEHLDGAFAVIAASSSPEVNHAAAEECGKRRIPVNVVDDPAFCSFIVPATVRRGDLTIAVSTGGKSPSMASDIRKKLEKEYGEDYAERLDILGEYRAELLKTETDGKRKKALLAAAAKMELRELKELTKK